MVRDNPDTEVTGPNLNALKARIDVVFALGFDIIVGTQLQVDTGQATHTMNNFIAAFQNNSRVLILSGTHALVQNEDVTQSGALIQMEDRSALLAMSSFTFTVSGNENQIKVKLDGAGLNAFKVTGDVNEMTLWFANGNADPLDDTGTDNIINFHVI
jgi:hypothetical protein